MSFQITIAETGSKKKRGGGKTKVVVGGTPIVAVAKKEKEQEEFKFEEPNERNTELELLKTNYKCSDPVENKERMANVVEAYLSNGKNVNKTRTWLDEVYGSS